MKKVTERVRKRARERRVKERGEGEVEDGFVTAAGLMFAANLF